MLAIDVRTDIAKATRALNDIQRTQIPFATSVALNKSAEAAQREVMKEIPRVFDRPTRYTTNSVFVRYSTKRKLSASVEVKDKAAKWLNPQIYGGARVPKGFEYRLRAAGALPPGWYALPGQAAKMDAYGNMSRGQIVTILSDLQAHRDPTANSTKESRAKRTARRSRVRQGIYFSPRAGSHLRPGVYERIGFAYGSAIRPVLIFTPNAPRYRPRLRFERIITDVIAYRFPAEFERSLRSALATAKG
jgi:hypothetical protein